MSFSENVTLIYKRGKRNSGRVISAKSFYCKFNRVATNTRQWTIQAETQLHCFDPASEIVSYQEVDSISSVGWVSMRSLTVETGESALISNRQSLLTSGGIVSATRLIVGDEILMKGTMQPMGARGRQPRDGIQRVIIEGLKFYSSGWRKIVYDAVSDIEYNYRRQHRSRLVVEADLNGMLYSQYLHLLKNDPAARALKALPEDVDVHHRDGNPANDKLENLIVLNKKEHAREHECDERRFGIAYTRTSKIVSFGKQVNSEGFNIKMCRSGLLFSISGGFFLPTAL